jgi:1-acyl-sn-glycerol-3-phosphate acyltransferase
MKEVDTTKNFNTTNGSHNIALDCYVNKSQQKTLDFSSRIKKIFKSYYAISPLVIDTIVCVFGKILFKIFASHQVEGLENIRNIPRGAIFAANHSSELDPIIVSVSLPLFSHFLPMFYTSRDKSFYKELGFFKKMMYGGFFFKILGAYPVNAGAHSYEKSLKTHVNLVQDGFSICIFPEGKRCVNGVIGQPRGGVGYLSYATSKPVIPVAINGVTHTKIFEFLTFKRKFKVIFGKPIYPKDIFPDTKEISEATMKDDCRAAAKFILDRITLMLCPSSQTSE